MAGKPEDHMRCRRKVVEYMEANPDDFAPFMEDDETWDDYVPRMKREREWGGHQEIVAASRLFKVCERWSRSRWIILLVGWLIG